FGTCFYGGCGRRRHGGLTSGRARAKGCTLVTFSVSWESSFGAAVASGGVGDADQTHVQAWKKRLSRKVLCEAICDRKKTR
ncbi:unnamed protein product, partial [Ixodes persulcatus]